MIALFVAAERSGLQLWKLALFFLFIVGVKVVQLVIDVRKIRRKTPESASETRLSGTVVDIKTAKGSNGSGHRFRLVVEFTNPDTGLPDRSARLPWQAAPDMSPFESSPPDVIGKQIPLVYDRETGTARSYRQAFDYTLLPGSSRKPTIAVEEEL